ncbi:hypothetical protein L198_00009 [Cryptococcus wingfieldii CBS 7118]|uniref:NAD(P)-binding protein n=1 Tax=Cryptococcus wingfieldii CBS 7118 TaxID=1295528 RepID=A0A1E3K5S4_9TREE|nr:hypothetical protein L198_00009 [Cryptococcus wingfieldii CBS 7118]ODO08286.1 hypothetical protein L198_00009 [Cryptococcus wingfieldii CBS 7118]
MAIFSSLAYNWQHFANHVGIPLFFWRRPTWSVRQMSEQSGKVVLITGGNAGTGYATALALYNAGANVTIAYRSLDHAREAVEGIKKNAESKVGTVDVLELLDLADLGSVQRAAEEYKTQPCQTAGLALLERWHHGHGNGPSKATLSNLKLWSSPTIASPPILCLSSCPPAPSRPESTSLASLAHNLAPPGGIDYLSLIRHPDDVPDPDGSPKRGKNEQERWAEYGQSKWGVYRFGEVSCGLAEKYDPKELIAVAVHPGSLSTNLFQPSRSGPVPIPFPEALARNGRYVTPFNHALEPRGDLVGEEGKKKAVELWEWCDEQGKKFQ